MTSINATPSTSNQDPQTDVVANITDTNAATPRKQLTKAERRELQEKQRAAKAAAAASGASTSKGPQGQKPTPNQSQKQSRKDPPANISTTGASSSMPLAQPSARRMNFRAGREAEIGAGAHASAAGAADTEAQRRHQTRIFSHFVVPKKEGKIGTGIKGDVHPVIIRLGRQFADMKIVGANARCIAMLVAFKTVGCAFYLI